MILVVDNYDSFTFNLVQVLATLHGDVRVVRNDAVTADEALATRPRASSSRPGPGRPEDAGISERAHPRATRTSRSSASASATRRSAHVFGASSCGRPVLMHGKTSEIRHDGRGIYAGLSNPFVGDALPLARRRARERSRAAST